MNPDVITKTANIWDWIGRINDTFTLLVVLVAIFLVVYSWWLNRFKSYWVWGLFFWPRACNKNLIDSPKGLPLVVSVRCQIVNVGLLPKVFKDVKLKLSEEGEYYELDPFAIMGPDCFIRKSEEGWTNDRKGLFRPIVVEQRSDRYFHLLFIPVSSFCSRLEQLSPGVYHGELIYKRIVGSDIPILFSFTIDEKDVDGFLEGDTSFGMLTRDLNFKARNKAI